MKKMILLLAVLAAMVWGCDDDESEDGPRGLSSELFYQTKWRGEFVKAEGGRRLEAISIDFVFVSENNVVVSCDTLYPEKLDTVYIVDGKDTLSWLLRPQIPAQDVFQSELGYSLDGDVLRFFGDAEEVVVGYWFLTDHNAALDSLCFRRETFDADIHERLVLMKRPFEWEE